MTTEIQNLAVAVVPSETGNNINPNSSLRKVLKCKETSIFKLTDYFEAQNRENLPLLHWSFLFDTKTKKILSDKPL